MQEAVTAVEMMPISTSLQDSCASADPSSQAQGIYHNIVANLFRHSAISGKVPLMRLKPKQILTSLSETLLVKKLIFFFET